MPSTTSERTRRPALGLFDLDCLPSAAAASVATIAPQAADWTVSRLLHPAARPVALESGLLRRIVDDLAGCLNQLQAPFLGSSARPEKTNPNPPGGSGERRFRLLVAAAELEVWLIEWGQASRLELHDHGDSSGAVRVLGGSLVEVSTDVEGSRPLERRILGPGAGFSFGRTYVHELWNPRETAALSVHAYSPPLGSMTFYRSNGRDLEPERTEIYR